jgi:thiol:disulfide interchange protein DsbD
MKSIQRCFLFLLWAVLAAAAPINGAKAAPTVTTDQVKAELLVHAPQGLRPGVAAWLGLKIVHKKGWHTYWVNPGDSGLPTQLQWQLPSGLKAGEIQWPVPQRLPIGPLMNHGYEGTLLLAVPLTAEQPLPETPQMIQLRADWLVCEDVCIPEGGDFSLTLPAGASRSALAKDSALFDQARASLPVEWPGASAAAQVDGQGLTLTLKGLPPAWQGRKLAIFPVAAHVLSPSVEPRAQWAADGAWAATLAYSAQRMEAPAAMEFVVALEQPSTKGASRAPDVASGDSSPAGIMLTASVGGAWPAADAAGTSIAMGASGGTPATGGTDAAGSGAGASASKAAAGWWTAAVLAVLGGLILNLMPCVFPVLSLKVFGFAADAHNRRALALGGLAYSLGVVLSFVALAALLLTLRASGEQLGWGFQLQSPPFVAALALLFTLMGLNLLGQFEFAMMVPGRWAAARARHPVVDHFLTGVLAVVVASPCTAPFMGASLGVAVTLPTLQALGIFAALGLGMAAPYLLLSLMPGWAARLPRPGAWMLKVKHAMALPMLATVVWLLWVLGHQAGVDAAAALLGLMLLMAFGIGAWGWAAGLSAGGRLASRAVVLAVVLGTAAWAWPLLQAQPDTKAASADARSDWAPWSPQAMEKELGQGRTVFVDYTAAWCVTCQANKRTTLRREEVLQALRERGIVTMEADWTRQDETITRELTRLGRSGVPVYAFYRSGADPVLLPEVLTPALMLNAIDKLPR